MKHIIKYLDMDFNGIFQSIINNDYYAVDKIDIHKKIIYVVNVTPNGNGSKQFPMTYEKFENILMKM